ncbi:MAG: molybdenum transporter ATP-binding protein [Pseudomonadota bacterium]|jgi:molybdate transport system ATP-binding protein
MIEAQLHWVQSAFTLSVDLRLPAQGVSVLLGPSGCGKTSLLRAMAGLSRARGRVAWQGRDGQAEVWQDDARGVWRPVHQRPIGMVFQEASLFPHLDVRANLLYGYQRLKPAQRKVHLDEAVALLGIGHLLGRGVGQLSGGERQRVAIARALLTSPALLLMDEPLSALDAARKAEVLPYLEALGRGGVPIVYVTHALDEAARLADHLVCMSQGQVTLAGEAVEVLSRVDTPLSQLDESAAVVEARVAAHEPDHGLSLLRLGDAPEQQLWVGQVAAAVGEVVRARVLARDVSVALSRAADSSILNILPATLCELSDSGDHSVMLRMSVAPGVWLQARLTRRSCQQLALRPGMAVYAQVKGAALL